MYFIRSQTRQRRFFMIDLTEVVLKQIPELASAKSCTSPVVAVMQESVEKYYRIKSVCQRAKAVDLSDLTEQNPHIAKYIEMLKNLHKNSTVLYRIGPIAMIVPLGNQEYVICSYIATTDDELVIKNT